jgi:poly [ADP-ribose] polymerase 2/3/4
MASKSANYCGFGLSDGEGLLLLCEAQLGKPLYECQGADTDAAKNCRAAVLPLIAYADCRGLLLHMALGLTCVYGTDSRGTRPDKFLDAKVLSPDLAGIMMPSPDSKAEAANLPNLSLLYDEVRLFVLC